MMYCSPMSVLMAEHLDGPTRKKITRSLLETVWSGFYFHFCPLNNVCGVTVPEHWEAAFCQGRHLLVCVIHSVGGTKTTDLSVLCRSIRFLTHSPNQSIQLTRLGLANSRIADQQTNRQFASSIDRGAGLKPCGARISNLSQSMSIVK